MAEKDQQLEMKKRARRRLVGAVALAVTAAVVLPMVMDREPRQSSQDIQIRIPSPESTGFTSKVLPAKPAEPTNPPSADDGSADAPIKASPPPVPQQKVPVPAAPALRATPTLDTAAAKDGGKQDAPSAPPKRSEDAAPTQKPSAPATVAQETAKRPEPTAATSPLPATPKHPETTAATSASAATGDKGKNEAARARELLEGSGQFVLQLGVFADPENVSKVRARVKAEGYNSFVEQIGQGAKAKTRVRAGPFSSRADAEKARERLKRSGLTGVVVPKS